MEFGMEMDIDRQAKTHSWAVVPKEGREEVYKLFM
jgi:hypothetical protein